MGATRRVSITLPEEMAQSVEDMIRSGAYASIDAVVEEGLRSVLEDADAIEQWLRDEVVPGHLEYLADPSQAVPSHEVLGRIKARRAAQKSRQT